MRSRLSDAHALLQLQLVNYLSHILPFVAELGAERSAKRFPPPTSYHSDFDPIKFHSLKLLHTFSTTTINTTTKSGQHTELPRATTEMEIVTSALLVLLEDIRPMPFIFR